jgi:integral membrane protein
MNRIKSLRIVGIAEGISFLVLLGIAMPLKYYFDLPLAVKYTGWAHGLLFVLFIIAVFFAIRPMKWNFFSVLVALASSLVPFGTFVLDRQLRRREKELSV